MFCNKCGTKLKEDSNFCANCGYNISGHKNDEMLVSEKKYLTNKELHCQVCGANKPTKNVKFLKNIGMIFMRRTYTIEGNLCKNCINDTFWKFTLTTLFVGWLGVISFIITPFFIINNIIQYLSSIKLEKDFK